MDVSHFARTSLFTCLCSFLCLCSGLSCQTVFALDSATALTHYSYRLWQTREGLPHNSVQAILRSHDGYLWVGTRDGLARFDGVRFIVFHQRNTPELAGNDIRALFEDRRGALWIGTNGGLTRLKDGVFTTYSQKEGLAANNVTAICEDRDGSLWIAAGNRVSHFKDERFTSYGFSSTVVALYAGRDGTLWIGTWGSGLIRFKDGSYSSYTPKNGLSSYSVFAIHEDHQGALWVGTLKGGLNRFKDGKFTTYGTEQGLVHRDVDVICEDHNGNLWIGTRGGGLNRLKDGSLAAYTTKDGLACDYITAIYEDYEGSLWIGTTTGGLIRLKDSNIINYTTRDGLTENFVTVVQGARDKSLWVGTNNKGVVRFKDGRFISYAAKHPLLADHVRSLHEGRDGSLWVAPVTRLARVKDTVVTTYTTHEDIAQDFIFSIYEDRQGNLWLGGRDRLLCMRDEKFVTYTNKDGLPKGVIHVIYEDREGNLWFGADGGLIRYKDEAFKVYTGTDSASLRFVFTIHEDAEGFLWLGTNGYGLYRFKNGDSTRYTTELGLLSNNLYWILEDGRENFWISSSRGIFSVSRKQLNDYAAGTVKSIASLAYGKPDGLQSGIALGGGFQPAGYTTGDGKMWFPTLTGLVMIDPNQTEVNESAPPVLIEQVIVDRQKVDMKGTGVIAPGQGDLEFQYTALNLLAPEKLAFKYKLEGFDKQWVEAGGRRTAYYTNIPPGEYRFRVLACNYAGVCYEKGADFPFYLRPHFYQTYWFYGLSVAAAAALVLMLYRARSRQLKSQFEAVLEERTRIAREIHDTIIQGVAATSAQLEAVTGIIECSPPAAQRHLERISLAVRKSLDDARRAVWDLRSARREERDLSTALTNLVRQITIDSPVQVQVYIDGAARPVPEATSYNLLRIAQEAVTNSVKHAGACLLSIELSFDHKLIRLKIKDDGCGFDPQAYSTPTGRWGLFGMRERAEKIGAQFYLQSSPGRGTQIEIIVPLD